MTRRSKVHRRMKAQRILRTVRRIAKGAGLMAAVATTFGAVLYGILTITIYAPSVWAFLLAALIIAALGLAAYEVGAMWERT